MDKKISVVVACYKDAQAIPIMYERLIKIFQKTNYDYEIIFVNDSSPDNTIQIIKKISKLDKNVIGINHTRNFGSQSAFLSGMQISKGTAVALMDGDLQDPPELLLDFILKWEEGFEVIYGVRKSREAPWYMQISYKLFYRIFSKLSSFQVPKDAGDFSLMDRKVVEFILKLDEREPFIRALRAFYGGKSCGIPYVRPERKFGKSTNNIFKNLGWAAKGLVAVSRIPLNLVTLLSFFLMPIALIVLIVLRIFFEGESSQILDSTFLIILVFIIFQNSILALYLGKVFEDVKKRPHFIRDSLIISGEIIDKK